MDSLLENFGLDWKLLVSQAANFFLLLVILRATVYKPLLKLIAERRKKIKDGLAHAEEADARLASIGTMQKKKEQEAEAKGLAMIREAGAKAKAEEARQLEEAATKVAELEQRAARARDAERATMMAEVEAASVALVTETIKKAVGAMPEGIDEAMIRKATQST
jgi:F-type H+-transporting ATPase subunit b